jgi:hypothetical protein
MRHLGFLMHSPLGHFFKKIRLKCHRYLNRRKVAPLPVSFGVSRDGCTAGQVDGAIASKYVCLRWLAGTGGRIGASMLAFPG